MGYITMKKEFNKQRFEIGQRIRKLRKRRDFCQEELAQEMEVSLSTVSRIENGTTRIDAEFLLQLSRVLDVSVDMILGTASGEKV